MISIRNSMLAVAATAFAFSVAGAACTQSPEDAREDVAEMPQKADQAAADAQQRAREEAQDAQRTAAEVGGRAGAAGETLAIKTALMADKMVDASEINVDTFAETRTVVLRGSVPTPQQKQQAEDIAKREAMGFTVDNQLTVKPPQ